MKDVTSQYELDMPDGYELVSVLDTHNTYLLVVEYIIPNEYRQQGGSGKAVTFLYKNCLKEVDWHGGRRQPRVQLKKRRGIRQIKEELGMDLISSGSRERSPFWIIFLNGKVQHKITASCEDELVRAFDRIRTA